MNNVSYKTINSEESGQRLDNYLIKLLKNVPRSHIYRLIRNGEVRVNKKRASVSLRLQCEDIIRIPPVRYSITDKEIFLSNKLKQQLLQSILFEDDNFLVMNKPAGIAVHGGSGLSIGIIEAMRKIFSNISYLELVHRLDKETSGCLLLAKKRSFLRSIQSLLRSRQVQKIYLALLKNRWTGKSSVTVDVPLKKNILSSQERIVIVDEAGKPSKTTFKLLENFSHASLLKIYPHTGRTHQIRVHSSYLGHPICGDAKYGYVNDLDLNKTKLYLHASSIQFNLNNRDYLFTADLDREFTATLEQLRAGLTSND